MDPSPIKIFNCNHVIIIVSLYSGIFGAFLLTKRIICRKVHPFISSLSEQARNSELRKELFYQKYENLAGLILLATGFVFQFINNIGSTVKIYAPTPFLKTALIFLVIYLAFYLLIDKVIKFSYLKSVGKVMKSKNIEIELVPRWCNPEDIQKGWAILHGSILKKIGVEHYQYIRIINNKNRIYCRVIGAGAQGRRYLGWTRLSKEEQNEILKESIFLESYFKKQLDLQKYYPQIKRNVEKVKFEIKRIKILGPFLTSWNHPNDSVKMGIRLALILGLSSVFLSLMSIFIF